MKSFYASVECVARGMNPLRANLLVADSSRSDQTICLAVSPALKAIGVPGRPRLFEAKQAIKKYENTHNTRIEYEIAVPRLLYRRLGVCACEVYSDNGIYQLNLFADYDKIDKERRLQCAMQEVRTKYGANAILRGINFLEDATTRERNMQIGEHRA